MKIYCSEKIEERVTSHKIPAMNYENHTSSTGMFVLGHASLNQLSRSWATLLWDTSTRP